MSDSRDLTQAASGASLPAHTPGPWFWALDEHNQPTNLMRSGTGDYVVSPQADVGTYGLSVDRWNDVSEADACLIAAAPDLLEAALEVIRCDECLAGNISMDDYDKAMKALRATIAKALGASPASLADGPTLATDTPK